MCKKLFLWIPLFLISLLPAEVELVTITWDPLVCKDHCIVNLQKKMSSLSQVASVDMHGAEGRMEIVWKPNTPFSFIPLNIGLRYVGVREKTVRVKVRGKIQGSGKNYSIISEGDRTPFVLINRVSTGFPMNYANEYNAGAANRELTPDLVQRLSEGKKKGVITTIEGLLFMPYRSPPMPLRLIIDQISFEDTNKKPAPKPVTPKKPLTF